MEVSIFWFCYVSKAAAWLTCQTLYGYIKILFQGDLLNVYSRAKVPDAKQEAGNVNERSGLSVRGNGVMRTETICHRPKA